MQNSPVVVGFNLPFDEAIAAMVSRGVVLPERYYGELQDLQRQFAFSIAGVASLDQLQQVLDSLSESLKTGDTFKQWQKSVEAKSLGLPEHRLDNIYRTNLQSAYGRGHWEQFQENKDVLGFLLYDAINDSRVRPSHSAMDGIIRHIDDPFWATNYPPNGHRCRCRCIALTEKQAQRRSTNDSGLNKPIDLEKMKSDKGFSYNVGSDLTRGINQAIQERRDNPDIEPKLINTLEMILKLFGQDNDRPND